MGSFQQCACQFNPIISKFSQIISWNWLKWIDRWFWGLWIITSEAIYFMCVCVLKPGMWPKGRTQNGNHKRKNMTLCKYRWGQWKHDRPNVIPCDQKKNFFFKFQVSRIAFTWKDWIRSFCSLWAWWLGVHTRVWDMPPSNLVMTSAYYPTDLKEGKKGKTDSYLNNSIDTWHCWFPFHIPRSIYS